MFEFLRGKLVSSSPIKVVIDVAGVGYGINISLKTFQQLPAIGSDLLLHVVPIIREDGHSLFGFFTKEEILFFKELLSVNGIGPKLAMVILGHIGIIDFQTAVIQGNISVLSKIPGIGKKTAERAVVELKNKFHITPTPQLPNNDTITDAISALINLGYSQLEAQKAIQKVVASQKKDLLLSELITGALRSI